MATDIAQYYDKDGNEISANALKDYFSVQDDGAGTLTVCARTISVSRIADSALVVFSTMLSKFAIVCSANLVGDLKLKLHVGADATRNNQITINLQAMSAKSLGVNGMLQ